MMMKRIMLGIVALVLLMCLQVAAFAAEPASDITAAVARYLQEYMQKQSENVTDGWQQYIYGCGITGITMALDKFEADPYKPVAVSFSIASGNPQMKVQPKYQGDPITYLDGIVKAMSTPDTRQKVNLIIVQNGGDYSVGFAPKAQAAFEKSVISIAEKAKKAFADKRILNALEDLLLPSPIKEAKKAPVSLSEAMVNPAYRAYQERVHMDDKSKRLLPALLYSTKNIKLDTAGGPRALKLTFETASPESMITESGIEVQSDMRYDAYAKGYTQDQIIASIIQKVEKQAINYRHGKTKGNLTFVAFDLFALPLKQDIFDLTAGSINRSNLLVALDNAVENITVFIGKLPDYPAVKAPKSGVVDGKSSGTKCIFNMPKDGLNYCVSVYSASTDQQILVAFSNNGSRLTVYIPKGDVYFIIGEGEIWYGGKYLFGNEGGYMKTENIQIKGSDYYHTFTIKPKSGGNTDVYRLNFDNLFQ